MAITHLSDDEIQSFLDGDVRENSAYIERHLSQCSRCRLEIKKYHMLYHGLKKDTGYNLNPGFSDAVLTRLVSTQSENTRSLFDRIVYITGILITLIIGGYFINLNELASSMASPFVPLFDAIGKFSESYFESISLSGQSLGILIFSLLLFVVIYFADNLLRNYKEKKFCL